VSSRVNPDYTATGTLDDVIAYVYGSVTLIEFNIAPSYVTVRNMAGEQVEFERVGRFYRLPKVLDFFTVHAYGRTATFSAPMITRVFSAPVKVSTAPSSELDKVPAGVNPAMFEPAPVQAGDEEDAALLKLCGRQLADIRHMLDAAGKNPEATGEDLFQLNHRLDVIEERMTSAGSAVIIQAGFPTRGTAFKPNPEIAAVLVASAKMADIVNVRGRTDSRVAGKRDAKIAQERANAARAYLVDRGVGAEKIRVFSRAAGDFAVPNVSPESRALNRRVEIELVNSRIPGFKSQSVKLVRSEAL
jgi:outer membrane protein OmpA-like peptidoglycan-associated protein